MHMITDHKRSATAVWEGTGLEGRGNLSTRSKAITNLAYTHKTRFGNTDGTSGTNPEELIAAAHAGCFTMALSFQLNANNFTADELRTEAVVVMSQEGVHYAIDHIILNLTATVDGISDDLLLELATNAKNGCPVSKALAAVRIELNVSRS